MSECLIVLRRIRLEDLLDVQPNTNYQNNSHHDFIAKNQPDFGHKKRIKP